jgi:hypothetical protein
MIEKVDFPDLVAVDDWHGEGHNLAVSKKEHPACGDISRRDWPCQAAWRS